PVDLRDGVRPRRRRVRRGADRHGIATRPVAVLVDVESERRDVQRQAEAARLGRRRPGGGRAAGWASYPGRDAEGRTLRGVLGECGPDEADARDEAEDRRETEGRGKSKDRGESG